MERTAEREQLGEDPAIEFGTPDLDTDANEAYAESWGDEQRALVSLNQDVIVICPWMDNAEVTLSTAMNTYEYPPNLTAEDEPFLISVVNELLANRVIKDEELEEPVVEVETETDVEVDEELAIDKNEAKLQEDEATPAKWSRRKVADSKTFKKAVVPVATKKQSTVQSVAETPQSEKPSTEPPESFRSESVVEVVTPKLASNVSAEQAKPSRPAVTIEDESSASQREVEVKIEKPAGVLEIVKPPAPEVIATSERPIVAELEESLTELDEEILDPIVQPLPDEVSVEAVPVEQDLEVERLTVLAEGEALSTDETVSASEDQPIVLSVPDNLDGVETENLDEEDVTVGPLATPPADVIDDDMSVAEQSVVGEGDESESRPWVGMETVTAGPPAEVDVVAELIMAEYTERSNSQNTEIANHYLDKIIEVAAEVQAFDGEDVIDETKATEELEELFIELFDEMGVSYTPELIENLVHRTLEQRLAKNKELEDEEIADDTPRGGLGTKLKKPSVGHVTLNDVIVHNRLISKVAFELCGFNASFSLN